VIALHAVTKRYGLRVPVLRDVDLELPGASVVGVEGENGAGKSTLLRLVAGVSVPSQGRVERSPALRTGLAVPPTARRPPSCSRPSTRSLRSRCTTSRRSYRR
jgi:ATPase subunit of ABC transporter with duplicated ATPase domains